MTTTQYTPTELSSLASALPYVERWLAHRVWATRVPGVQAAVHFDGRLQWSGAFGVADITTGEALTTDHLFRIASHSKTFTATAVLQLVEAGALRFDDTAASLVPELQGSAVGGATVRELLGHSAGIIRDGLDGDYWQHSRQFPDRDELLAILREEGRVLEPNEAFKYTNIGYSLLGLIVGAVSGAGYNEYVAEHICARLGLAKTGPEWDPARAGEFAAAHTGLHTSRERRRIDHVDTRAMAAATGFFSTAEDLTRYFAAHTLGDERLLSDASKRLQQRDEWLTNPLDEKSGHYGLGMISERLGGRKVIGHSGGYPGHITRTILDPEKGLVVSVLTNAVDGPASELAVGALALLDYALEKPTTETTPDASPFVGRFANMWGVIDVAQLGDRIVAVHPGSPDPITALDTLTVSSPAALEFDTGSGYGSIGEKLHYVFDESGAITSIRGGGGMTMWPLGPLADEHGGGE